MDQIFEDIKKELKAPITFIASIVTLANGILPIVNKGATTGVYLGSYSLSLSSIEFAVILLLVLEGLLGDFFSKVIVHIEAFGTGIARLFLFIIACFYAWISIFNVNWFIKNTLISNYGWKPEEAGFIVFLGVVGVVILSLYLINHHGKMVNDVQSYTDKTEDPHQSLIGAFILMQFLDWMT